MYKRTRFIIPLIIFSVFISCKSFDNKLLEQKGYIDKSVRPMKLVINQPSVEKFCTPNKFVTSSEVTNTLKQNLIFESARGDIYLSVIIFRSKVKSFSHLYEILALMVPVFFGAVINTVTYTITLEAAVMNHKGDILKTYTSTGSDKEWRGGTGHFTLTGPDGPKTAYIKALLSACNDLREQLKKDKNYINKLAL